jgi:NADH dehydrogenase [ubiquinone] 1 alpha subcomplex assembly factor 7
LLKKIVERNKLFVNGITTQREFLKKLGIIKRAEILSKNLPFTEKANIYYRLKRLIDEKYMGQLFKVMFITKKKSSFNLGF